MDSPHSEKESGDRKDHQLVNNEVQLRPVDAAHHNIVPPILITTLPTVQMLLARVEPKLPAFPPVNFADSPPPAVMVARTVVFLI